MGYNGPCRREQLTSMSADGIQYKNNMIMVSVPKTKNKVQRNFAVTNDKHVKYVNLCPKHNRIGVFS